MENMVFGYMGVRYAREGLSVSPKLPAFGVEEVVLRGLSFRSGVVRLVANSTHMQLSRAQGASTLYINCTADSGGGSSTKIKMAVAPAVTTMKRQQVWIW